jgi:hypothetical protein
MSSQDSDKQLGLRAWWFPKNKCKGVTSLCGVRWISTLHTSLTRFLTAYHVLCTPRRCFEKETGWEKV